MLQVEFRKLKSINYGVQLEAISGSAKALLDFYSGSKKKRIVVKPGGDASLCRLLEVNTDKVRSLLLTAGLPIAMDLDEPEPSPSLNGAVMVWSDGGSKPNPGPGGYGVLIRYPDGRELELGGYDPDTTNNRMEMTAVVRALEETKDCGLPLYITVDSTYVKQGITSWISGWKRRGWKTAAGTPVLNRDLWEAMDGLTIMRNIQWEWVRGHSGHVENERVDAIATEARREKSDIRRERETVR